MKMSPVGMVNKVAAAKTPDGKNPHNDISKAKMPNIGSSKVVANGVPISGGY